MKTAVLALMASAGIAAAQTTSAYVGNTICAEDVLQACIATENLNVSACEANDWGCLCHAYGLVLGCYNDCPSDPGFYTAQQEQVVNCNAANAYPSTSTAIAAATTAPVAAASKAHSQNGGSGASQTPAPGATNTGSAAASTSTGAAAGLFVPAGGLVLGLVGLFF